MYRWGSLWISFNHDSNSLGWSFLRDSVVKRGQTVEIQDTSCLGVGVTD